MFWSVTAPNFFISSCRLLPIPSFTLKIFPKIGSNFLRNCFKNVILCKYLQNYIVSIHTTMIWFGCWGWKKGKTIAIRTFDGDASITIKAAIKRMEHEKEDRKEDRTRETRKQVLELSPWGWSLLFHTLVQKSQDMIVWSNAYFGRKCNRSQAIWMDVCSWNAWKCPWKDEC